MRTEEFGSGDVADQLGRLLWLVEVKGLLETLFSSSCKHPDLKEREA